MVNILISTKFILSYIWYVEQKKYVGRLLVKYVRLKLPWTKMQKSAAELMEVKHTRDTLNISYTDI